MTSAQILHLFLWFDSRGRRLPEGTNVLECVNAFVAGAVWMFWINEGFAE